jgi:hypothetical protein
MRFLGFFKIKYRRRVHGQTLPDLRSFKAWMKVVHFQIGDLLRLG